MRQDRGTAIFPDRGYSFCNCKNIWFTEWGNIDLRNKHSNESKEVAHYYLRDMGLTHNKDDKFQIELVYIMNKGLANNNVLIEGDAPETKAEFERLGFVLSGPPYDIIWAYHTMEHEKDPLEKLALYNRLLKDKGILFVAMPDPFFIEFGDIYKWDHWLLREHHIMWDMDSFCDEAKALGLKIVYKTRNTAVKVCKDMHIILEKA